MATVIHPHAGFTGSVGPVRFDNGVAVTDDPEHLELLEAAGLVPAPFIGPEQDPDNEE